MKRGFCDISSTKNAPMRRMRAVIIRSVKSCIYSLLLIGEDYAYKAGMQ